MPPNWSTGGYDFHLKPAPHDPIAAGAAAGIQTRNAATGMTLFDQSHMPFGDHAGKMMERVPASYYLELLAAAPRLERRWQHILEYIERNLPHIEARAEKEARKAKPKELSEYLYLPPDMEECYEKYNSMCGHGALAACLGVPVQAAHALLGKDGWINIPMMKDALTKAGRRFTTLRNGQWPTRGSSVVMIQFLGPWMDPKVPPAARCAHRHWIAVRDLIVTDKIVIWDSNSLQWQTRAEWETQIIPDLLANHTKTTGWDVAIALTI